MKDKKAFDLKKEYNMRSSLDCTIRIFFFFFSYICFIYFLSFSNSAAELPDIRNLLQHRAPVFIIGFIFFIVSLLSDEHVSHALNQSLVTYSRRRSLFC